MARPGGSKRGRKLRTSTRPSPGNEVPDIYREMLVDAVSSSPTKLGVEGKVVKKRRVRGRVVAQGHNDTSEQSDQASTIATNTDIDEAVLQHGSVRQQTAYTESEDSADSDIDWQDINLTHDPKLNDIQDHDGPEHSELDLVLGGDSNGTPTKLTLKRKPVTAAERRIRLEIHKMHVMSLLAHIHLRNHWCNDEEVHGALRSLLSKRTRSYLNPEIIKSQFQRSRSFVDGLGQALDAFKEKYKITARGLSRSHWADTPEDLANIGLPEDLDLPMQRPDFRIAAVTLGASRDIGAQLFCALLRSAGVDARLVCSLQPLPFTATGKVSLSSLPKPPMIMAYPESRNITSCDESETEAQTDRSRPSEKVIGSTGGRTRFASPQIAQTSPINKIASPGPKLPAKPKPPRKRIKESPYPIYWIEALDEAYQKWIPVDPLVTATISKPSKLEPPASDPENRLNYVVAFEDDGSARDVTRRYSRAYNAKTRRGRVEVTNGGQVWWRRVMRMYRRSHDLDRDQIEDTQLTAKEAQERMPNNVQDFKGHPYYALERHLKRSEVIHPTREVGKVTSGKALEPIYRRRDVHIVKSADKWYRLGREIKAGEQPLKRVAARRNRDADLDNGRHSEDEDDTGTGLYAVHQTTIYTAPPVVNGRIPKNIYGNLDIYAPSMVPPGAVHIHNSETVRAARILGVDYADAVTGFAFKGRHGTAVINGAVVATECRDAVEEVIQGFEDERAEAEEARKSFEALKMWRRLLAGLRIKERIEGYDIEGERNAKPKHTKGIDRTLDNSVDNDDGEGGGFLPDRDAQGDVEPTAGRLLEQPFIDHGQYEGGGFIAEEEQEQADEDPNEDETPIPHPPHAADPFLNKIPDDDRGGYYAYDIDEDAEEAVRGIELTDQTDEYERFSPGGADGNAAGELPPTDDGSIVDEDKGEGVDAKKLEMETDEGGGFVVDDENEHAQDSEQMNTPPPPSNSARRDLTSSKSVTTTPPQLQSQPSHNHPPTSSPQFEMEEPIQPPHKEEQEISDTANHNNQTASPPSPLRDQCLPNAPTVAARTETSDQDQESDAGSLLSHDPEDEDAEPEWLA